MTKLSEAVVLVSYLDGGAVNTSFRSWSFNFDKHAFYVGHLGHEGTLIFDATSLQWLEWETTGYDNWNAEHGIDWNGGVYFGDNSLPILWRMEPDSFLDDDFRLITRTVTGVLPASGRATTSAGMFVLDVTREAEAVDNQSVPYVQLFVSDDGGFIFDEREKISLAAGEQQDFAWRGLGQIKNPGRVYRIVDQGGLATIRGADQRLDDEDDDDTAQRN